MCRGGARIQCRQTDDLGCGGPVVSHCPEQSGAMHVRRSAMQCNEAMCECVGDMERWEQLAFT